MTVRLFVAIWPGASARQALVDSVVPVHQAAPDVHWQPPERWHITLAFLGQADPVKAARRITTRVARGLLAPEPIRLASAGTFGPVIWVGVEHGPWLTSLASGLQDALRVADRRFRAHVTVGRVRGPDGPTRAREVAPMLNGHVGPAWVPTEISLVESTSGPSPEYRILERWQIGATDPAGDWRAPSRDSHGDAMPDSAVPTILEAP